MSKSKIKNKSKKMVSSIFQSKKNEIYNYCLYCHKSLNSNPQVKVTIKDDIDCNGSVCKKHNHYELLLNSKTIIENDYFAKPIILHEYAHIFDIENSTPCFKYSTIKSPYCNKLEDFIISIGFRYWTEFFAYCNTFDKFYAKTCSLLQMVNEYKEIICYSKKMNSESNFNELIDRINNFLYRTSIFLAKAATSQKKYKYCEKTTNDKSFKYVSQLFNDLSNKYRTMFHGLYGKRFKKRIYKIGEFIIDNFYVPFNIVPTRYKSGYVLGYISK